MLQSCFTKQSLSCQAARWVKVLGQFEISKVTLEKGRVHILGDTILRAPQIVQFKASIINNTTARVLNIDFLPNLIDNYSLNSLFGPIHRALQGLLAKPKIELDRVQKLLLNLLIREVEQFISIYYTRTRYKFREKTTGYSSNFYMIAELRENF